MLSFNVSMPDIDSVEKDAYKKLQVVLQKSMFKMEELAIKKAPHDRGFLRQNISLSPRNLSNRYVLKSNAPYSEDLEYGNTPRFVKLDVLQEWALRKNIVNDEARAWVFAKYVQEKIAREGVNPQPFMRPAFHEVKTKWLNVFIQQEFK